MKKASTILLELIALFFITTLPALACSISISPSSTTANTDTSINLSVTNDESSTAYNRIILQSSNPTVSNIACTGSNGWCADITPDRMQVLSPTQLLWNSEGLAEVDAIHPGQTFDGFTFTFNGSLPTTFTASTYHDDNSIVISTCQATLTSSTPVNHAPIAVAGTSLDVNNNLQLDGSLSSDPDNDPLTYTWQIAGEPSTRSGKTTSISDLTRGTYNVTLTVSDGSLQSVDTTTIGVVTKRPTATVGMTINTMQINKSTGGFQISGKWDTTNPLFGTVLNSPLSRLLFELQTGGTSTNPMYGVVGEDLLSLTTSGNLLH